MTTLNHYCHNCGASFLGSQTHCGSCGAELNPPTFGRSSQAVSYCRGCGASVFDYQNFCRSCGANLGQPEYAHPRQRSNAGSQTLDYYIPPSRILLLSVLSASLYGFYWFYITWKHYRDHIGEEMNFPVWHAPTLPGPIYNLVRWFYITWKHFRDHTGEEMHFPVLHALTQLIPIYNLFRFHYHVRVYQRLMDAVGVRTTIAAGTAVTFMAIALVAGVISIVMVNPNVNAQVSQSEAIISFALTLVSVVIPWFVMYLVQANLNRYWLTYADRNPGVSIATSEVGVGAVVLTIIGILFWVITISGLFTGGQSGVEAA